MFFLFKNVVMSRQIFVGLVLVTLSLYSTIGWILSCIFAFSYSYWLIDQIAKQTKAKKNENKNQDNLRQSREPISEVKKRMKEKKLVFFIYATNIS